MSHHSPHLLLAGTTTAISYESPLTAPAPRRYNNCHIAWVTTHRTCSSQVQLPYRMSHHSPHLLLAGTTTAISHESPLTAPAPRRYNNCHIAWVTTHRTCSSQVQQLPYRMSHHSPHLLLAGTTTAISHESPLTAPAPRRYNNCHIAWVTTHRTCSSQVQQLPYRMSHHSPHLLLAGTATAIPHESPLTAPAPRRYNNRHIAWVTTHRTCSSQVQQLPYRMSHHSPHLLLAGTTTAISHESPLTAPAPRRYNNRHIAWVTTHRTCSSQIKSLIVPL